MDEQSQSLKLRRHRSLAEAGQLVAEYEASGLARAEFCRQHGLSLATLARYRKRHAQGLAVPQDGWVEVEAAGACPAPESASPSGLSLALPGGHRIDVGRGFDAHTLLALLSLLERR